jgi:hypothetical protein
MRRFLPDLQRDGDDIVALLLEESGSDGTIDTTGHGDDYGFWG